MFVRSVPKYHKLLALFIFYIFLNFVLVMPLKDVVAVALGMYKKRQHLIFMIFLCFTVEKTFGPWDLNRIVIVFYRHNYFNKVGCVNQL